MRGKRYNREEILIDVTSLLDVVFIFLLIVLCNQQKFDKDLVEREQQIQEIEDQKALYQQKLDMRDNMQKYAMTVAIQSSYDVADYKKRYIRVLAGDKEEPDIFDLDGEDTGESMTKFEENLTACIEEDLERPVVFSFNVEDEKILRRDKIAIEDTLTALKNKYENVFISNRRP